MHFGCLKIGTVGPQNQVPLRVGKIREESHDVDVDDEIQLPHVPTIHKLPM